MASDVSDLRSEFRHSDAFPSLRPGEIADADGLHRELDAEGDALPGSAAYRIHPTNPAVPAEWLSFSVESMLRELQSQRRPRQAPAEPTRQATAAS